MPGTKGFSLKGKKSERVLFHRPGNSPGARLGTRLAQPVWGTLAEATRGAGGFLVHTGMDQLCTHDEDDGDQPPGRGSGHSMDQLASPWGVSL